MTSNTGITPRTLSSLSQPRQNNQTLEMSSTFTTFAEAEVFLQNCGLPKELIETSISEVVESIHVMQIKFEGKTGGLHSSNVLPCLGLSANKGEVYILHLGGLGGSHIKIIVSYKENDSVAYLSDFSAAEKELIESASDAPLHPAQIPTIILENVTRTLSKDVKDIHERIKNIEPIQADSPKLPPISQQLWDIAKSINSLKYQLSQARIVVASVQKLLGHFEKHFRNDAQQTLEDRVTNVLSRLEREESLLAKAEADITAYKTWLDAHVAKSQHLMAISSWKSGKSMYVMSVMAVMFWPTTICMLFLNLPFWNWNAGAGDDLLNPRWFFIMPVVWVATMLSFFLWIVGTWLLIHFSDVNDVEDE